jgi:radical SAM superfamily enzyme YgiQ (UPF0313 family)
MKKVFLISPNSIDHLDASLISYSLALGYLGAYAERVGWKVIVRDCYCKTWEETKREIIQVIKHENPEVIGINCITMNRAAVYKTIELAKSLKPKIKVIVGGVHPTIYPEHFLLNNNADIVVMHEGEETFEELLKRFDKNQSIKNVRGIAYKENGAVNITPARPQICDLEKMPFMKHDYFLNSESTKAFFFSSRGCPNNCSFCSASVHWGQRYRARSTKNVVDEIEYVVKNYPKINEIRFMDDTFTLDNQRVIEICKEMIRRKIKVKWRCSGRVFPISGEMIKWMERAGCIMISFGVESGSPRLLREMGKNQTTDQIFNAFKIVYENSTKITPEMFLILGFPNENEESVNETISLIKRVISVSGKPLILTAARVLEIYPGTRLFNLAKEKGMIDDSFWLKSPKTPQYLERDPSWFKKQRNKILFVNWTYAGPLPVVKLFFERQIWRPRKIYNIIYPYLKGIN